MKHAAGPWCGQDTVPLDPKALIVLQVADMRDGRSRYMLVHFVRGHWVFPDRSRLSELYVPVRWAQLATE